MTFAEQRQIESLLDDLIARRIAPFSALHAYADHRSRGIEVLEDGRWVRFWSVRDAEEYAAEIEAQARTDAGEWDEFHAAYESR